MPSTKGVARTVAEEMKENGEYATTVGEAFGIVKDEGGFDAPWRDHVVNGFEYKGWERSGDVLYLPDKLTEKSAEFAQKLQSEGRPVVSRGVVSQEVAGFDYPSDEWGDQIDSAMEQEGWEVDKENGIYYLPMEELVTESSLAHYVFGSFNFN